MKVKAIKQMQYGKQIVEVGDIGEVLGHKETIYNIDYDYYVSFNSNRPFGVFEDEIERIEERSSE
jgi:hypothetical protein